jgi:release factor glutamine methyltransferase
MRIDLATWLQQAQPRLAPITDTPLLETQLIAAETLHKPRTWIITHTDYILLDAVHEKMETLLDKRSQGIPLPYLLGHWEFFDLDFTITPDVLIPRPETEVLVELAEKWIQNHPRITNIADVGTGSGCIAVSLAVHHPDLSITAVDSSMAALSVAKQNSIQHAANNIAFFCGNLLSAVSGQFELVCANLPYIPTQTVKNLPVATHEPNMALDGGEDGLELIARLLQDCPRWMASGGCLLLEIESGQGKSAPALAASLLPKSSIKLHHDLANLPRVLEIRWGG